MAVDSPLGGTLPLLYGFSLEITLNWKFLGPVLETKLTFKKHIGEICSKIAIIYRLKDLLPRKLLLSLYYQFVYPYLLYCSLRWV